MGSKADDVLEKCGALGKYQIIQTFLISMISFANGQHFLAVVFHMYEPKHRCAIPGWPNDTYSIQGVSHNESINLFMNTEDGGCTMNSTVCSRYVYDKSQYAGETVVEKFNLVCDRTGLATLSTTLFTVGLMPGAFICGVISDRIGRKWTLSFVMLLATASSCATIFSQNMIMYISLRLITGGCLIGCAIVVSVLGLEMTGPSRRPVAMVIRGLFFPAGIMSLSLVCYLLPNWKDNQIVLTVITALVTISLIVFVKESPHFLIVNGRHEAARELFHYMATMNGKTIDDKLIDDLQENEQGATQEKVISLFKAKTLLKRTFVFFYMWFIAGLGYYGLSFNVKNMGGDLFINHLVSSSVELLVWIPILASKWLGRKPMAVVHLFLGGAALMTNAMALIFLADMENPPIDVDALNTGVFLIGKYSISVIFGFAYFWCTEVYPSTLRSTLSGISSVFARVGSILSPILVDLYKFVDTPLKLGIGPLVFSITMLLGGFLSLMLPETSNTKVPETIAEANAFKSPKHNNRTYSLSTEGNFNKAYESEEKL